MTDTKLNNVEYDVLNTIALKKMTTVQAIADASGVPLDEVAGIVETLEASGLAATIGAQTLPMDGAVAVLIASAADRYGELRADPEIAIMATKFETVNGLFLVAISSWQQIEVGGKKITNEHTDFEYDSKVLDKIDKLVGRLVRLISVLSASDARFDRYAVRFNRANDHVAAGALEFVSSPIVESVHNIWFEFHEDLLRTLGHERRE